MGCLLLLGNNISTQNRLLNYNSRRASLYFFQVSISNDKGEGKKICLAILKGYSIKNGVFCCLLFTKVTVIPTTMVIIDIRIRKSSIDSPVPKKLFCCCIIEISKGVGVCIVVGVKVGVCVGARIGVVVGTGVGVGVDVGDGVGGGV